MKKLIMTICLVLLGFAVCEATMSSNLSQLINELNELSADALSDEVKNSLISKVENALKSIDKEKDEVAVKMLQAFINEVEALRGKKISEDTADMLVKTANNLINEIESGLSAEISFLSPHGQIMSDDNITSWSWFNGPTIEDWELKYPEEYWGTYASYLLGSVLKVQIEMVNNGPELLGVTIAVKAERIETDGSIGESICLFKTGNAEIEPGEIKLAGINRTLPTDGRSLCLLTITIYDEAGKFTIVRKAIFGIGYYEIGPGLIAEISFLSPYGITVIDSGGTHWQNGIIMTESGRVYPEEYWGTYPRYLLGSVLKVQLKMVNNGPELLGVIIAVKAERIETDGSIGESICLFKTGNAYIEPGEIKLAGINRTLPTDGRSLCLLTITIYDEAGKFTIVRKALFGMG